MVLIEHLKSGELSGPKRRSRARRDDKAKEGAGKKLEWSVCCGQFFAVAKRSPIEGHPAIRRFFQSKGLEYLESNRITGNVGSTLSGIRTRVQNLPETNRSLPVSTTRPKLLIAFLNPELGYGCFAGQDIQQGQVIGEYTGLLLSNNSGRYDSHYAIDLIPEAIQSQVGANLYLSAAKGGSELRFVNHLSPNVEVRYPDGRTETGPNAKIQRIWSNNQFHIYYVATRLIRSGDEIRIQYHWAPNQFPGGQPSKKVYHYT